MRAGLYLLIATFPLINRDLFALFNPQIFPSRIVLVVLLAVGTILFLKGGKWVKRVKVEIKRDSFLFFLLALWAVRAVSIFQTKNLGASLLLLVFYSSMVGLYLLLKYFFDWRYYLWHTVVVVVVGLFGLLEVLWAFQKTTFPGVLLGGNYLRVPATFYDANHLPAYLLTALPFLLVLFWRAKGFLRKSALGGLVCLLTLLLLSTFSRSGMIGWAISFFVFWLLLLSFKYYRKALAMGGVAVVVIAAAVLTSRTEYSLFSRLGSVLNPAEKSTTAHETLLLGEWRLFLKHPLLGVGYGSFSETFRESEWGKEHLYVDPTQNIRLPAHSIWLEVLTETGLLGFVPYILALGLVLLTLSYALRVTKDKKTRLFLAALSSGLVGIFVSGIFYSYNLEFFFFYLFFSYLLALRIVSGRVSLEEQEETKEEINKLDLALPAFLVLLSGFFVFYRLGSTGLIDWDEAIYAGISKNILSFKDFLTLRWIDNVPWFEKPPLYMWLTSIMIFFYGVSSFAARFWSAFFGVGTVVVTYFFGKDILKSRFGGFLAALMLATTTVFLYYSRNGMLDVTFTFFATSGLYLYWLTKTHPKGGFGNWGAFFSGVSVGLAFMTKGLVGVLPLGVIAGFELVLVWEEVRRIGGGLKQRFKFLFSPLLILSLGVFAAAAPWHLLMLAKYGRDFFDSYFVYHVFRRGVEAIEGKTAPLFWYLTVIKVGFRIWAIPLLAGVPYAVYRVYKGYQEGKGERVGVFLLLCAGVIFGIYNLEKSKLVWYIIPIYPVLSLLNAYFFLGVLGFLERTKFGKLWSVKITRMFLASVFVVPGVFYVYLERARVYPADFTKEEVALISKRNEFDARNNIELALPGIASPAARYYNDGPVREISKEELPEWLKNNEPRYVLLSFSDYRKFKAELSPNGVELKLVGSFPSENDLVLVERVVL